MLTGLISVNMKEIVSVEIDEVVIPVEYHIGIPDVDNLIYIKNDYESLVFLAHDGLSGIYIKRLLDTKDIIVNYSNGVSERLVYSNTIWATINIPARITYGAHDRFIFQTCEGSNGDIMLIIFKRGTTLARYIW